MQENKNKKKRANREMFFWLARMQYGFISYKKELLLLLFYQSRLDIYFFNTL